VRHAIRVPACSARQTLHGGVLIFEWWRPARNAMSQVRDKGQSLPIQRIDAAIGPGLRLANFPRRVQRQDNRARASCQKSPAGIKKSASSQAVNRGARASSPPCFASCGTLVSCSTNSPESAGRMPAKAGCWREERDPPLSSRAPLKPRPRGPVSEERQPQAARQPSAPPPRAARERLRRRLYQKAHRARRRQRSDLQRHFE